MNDLKVKKILLALSGCGTCNRLKTAAIIFKKGTIVSVGYNGSVRGSAECSKIGCFIISNHCQNSVHAEENAILNAARNGASVLGGKIYCLHFPCRNCLKSIMNSGIREIVYYRNYNDESNKKLLRRYLDEGLLEVRKA